MHSNAVHAHNLPGISAHEFLLAVMHSPTVDLHDRMVAAEELCRQGLGDIGAIRTLKIVIEGGLGYIPTAERSRAPGTHLGLWGDAHLTRVL
jgi:hypothetical protein